MHSVSSLFLFSLVTPEKLIFSSEIQMVVIPGQKGEFGVLPNHAPLVSVIKPGILTIYEDNEANYRFFISRGFAKVQPDHCTVLVQEALAVADITLDEVKKYIKKIEDYIDIARTEEEKEKLRADLNLAKAKFDSLKGLR